MDSLLSRQRECEAIRNSVYDPKKHQTEADYLIDCFSRLFETDLCSCQELYDILKPETPLELQIELKPEDYHSVLGYATRVRQHKSTFWKPSNPWSNTRYQDNRRGDNRGKLGNIGFTGGAPPDGEEGDDELQNDPSGNK